MKCSIHPGKAVWVGRLPRVALSEGHSNHQSQGVRARAMRTEKGAEAVLLEQPILQEILLSF